MPFRDTYLQPFEMHPQHSNLEMKLKTTLLWLFILVLTCHTLEAQQSTTSADHIVTDSILTPGEQALNLIGQNDTKKAILLLLASPHTEDLLLLQSRFEKNNRDYTNGTIDFETWDIEHNRINYALLALIPVRPKQPGKVASSDLDRLIMESDTQGALKLLIDAGSTDAILLQARYLRVAKQRRQGTIDNQTFYRVNTHINFAILELNQD